jgi:hypothetical protein
MKMYALNLFASYAHDEAIDALPCVTNDCVFFDRDLVWSNDHGVARPEKREGLGSANGELIR